MRLPDRAVIRQSNPEDPLPYYYKPLFGWFYRRRLAMTLELLGSRGYDRILDIGYGSGILFPELARRARALAGIDLHANFEPVKEMLAAERISAELKSGSVLELPWPDGSFDGVICLSVLEFVTDLEKAVSELARVLAPGGTAVIGAPVINPLTSLGYRLLGITDQDAKHVADQDRILHTMDLHFSRKRVLTLPGLFPLRWSLFVCAQYVKEGGA